MAYLDQLNALKAELIASIEAETDNQVRYTLIDTLSKINSIVSPLTIEGGVNITGLTQTELSTELQTLEDRVGSLTETAPTTDTSSSGLNGRLQRIAQRLTTLLPQTSGKVSVSVDAAIGLTTTSDTNSPEVLAIGDKEDVAASSDTGTFSLLAFLKRLLSTKLKTGSNTTSNSLAVNLASDHVDIGTKRSLVAVDGYAYSVYRTTSLTNTPLAVKSSAGNLYGLNIINPNNYIIYVKFFDLAQGSTTVGTSTISRIFAIPANGAVFFVLDNSIKYFSTAITLAATLSLADGDNTTLGVPAYAEIYYK